MSRASSPRERRGFLPSGVFGAGTTGAAINMFISSGAYGALWLAISSLEFYAVVLLITALIFLAPFCSRRFGARGKSGVSL